MPYAHIYRLDLIPDIDQGLLRVNILGSESAVGAKVQVDQWHTLLNWFQNNAVTYSRFAQGQMKAWYAYLSKHGAEVSGCPHTVTSQCCQATQATIAASWMKADYFPVTHHSDDA